MIGDGLAPLPAKSFVTLDGADNLLSDRANAEYAARILAAWSSRYVAAPTATAGLTNADPVDSAGQRPKRR